jgi:hypothetical protein
MTLLSRPRRPARPHEWTQGKAVTFIVTLAATRSVTLAAREAGMSRKSAYALKSRDSAFAAAWAEAQKPRSKRRQGDKVDRAGTPPAPPPQGDKANPAALPISQAVRRLADQARDDFFAALAADLRRPRVAAAGLSPPPQPLSLGVEGNSRWRR